MAKDADMARRKAAECMALAAKTRLEERSSVLLAMARSWMTLANQMDRLDGTRARVPAGKRSARST